MHSNQFLSKIKLAFFNVILSRDCFVIELESYPEQLEEALIFLSGYLQNPSVPPDKFYRLQKKIIANFQDDGKEAQKLYQGASQELAQRVRRYLDRNRLLCFLRNQLEPFPIDQVKEALAKLFIKEFKSYIRNYFTRENLVISAAGNIETNRLIKAVSVSLGQLPCQGKSYNIAPTSPLQETKPRFFWRDSPDSVICFARPWLSRPAGITQATKGLLLGKLMIMLLSQQLPESCKTRGINIQINPGNNWLTGCLSMQNSAVDDSLMQIKQYFAFAEKVKIQDLKQGAYRLDQLKAALMKERISFLNLFKEKNEYDAFYLFNKQIHTLPWMVDIQADFTNLWQIQLTDLVSIMKENWEFKPLSWVEVGKKNHLRAIA